ncbi:MAG: hypothetical protein FJ104_02475 [Deltaproteobacteria bacterium]|nr:hypothetical protein [Deltaproteobacteria bacterium]
MGPLGLRAYLLVVGLIAAAAVGLSTPALRTGLQYDDWGVIAAHQLGWSYARGGDPEFDRGANVRARDLGYLPWFVDVDRRVAMLRPLGVATVELDFTLFGPEGARWMHAHSLAWLVALVAASAAALRRLSTSPLGALLGLGFYALDDAHGVAIAWISSRHLLMVATFGCLALVAQDAATRSGWRYGRVAAAACVGLGLACSEAGLAIAAQLLAHAVCLAPGPPARRARDAAAWVLVVALWLAIWIAGDHGVRSVGDYVDPSTEPGRFALRFVSRWVSQGTAKLGGLGGGTDLLPGAAPAWVRAALPLAAVVAIAPLVRASPIHRFWALSFLLAGIPLAAAEPQPRLLVVSGLGASALLGSLVAGVVTTARRELYPLALHRVAVTAIAASAAVTHGLLSPMLLTHTTRLWAVPRAELDLLADVARDVRPTDELVVVHAPDYTRGVGGLTMAFVKGHPLPRSLRILHAGADPVLVERLDERTLRLRAAGTFGGVIDWKLFRTRPCSRGEVVALEGMTATLEEVDAGTGRPLVVRFAFARPIDEATMQWKSWQAGRYSPWAPPAIGESAWVRP